MIDLDRCCRVGLELDDKCSKKRDLYLDARGRRWCRDHLGDKRWQDSCTHTGHTGNVVCGYCRKDLT